MTIHDIKSISKLIIYIVIITFIIDKAIYFSLTAISNQIYSGQSVGKLNHYLSIKDTTDVIVFGNSRANHHIDTRKIAKSSYNIGVDGTSIAYSWTLIKTLPKAKDQLVILHLDTKKMFDVTYKGRDVLALLQKYHQNSLIRDKIDELKLTPLLNKLYWCINYNGKILGILKNYIIPKYNHQKYYGYDPLVVDGTQIKMLEKKLDQTQKVVCEEEVKLNSVYKRGIEDIHHFCKKNNKKLIIVTSPIYNDQCKNDNIFLKKMMLEKGITYYDYSDFFIKANTLSYWKDETHLSNKGATLFSDELSHVIRFSNE